MTTVLPEPYGTDPLVTDSVVVKNLDADLKVYPDLYAAGSEPLDEDEMRLTVLGSGYPSRRGQGCAGFMVELGNGEVFLFDAGSGTNAAFNHMKVPYHKANKIFITHNHLDHIGDLLAYYDFGQSNGRMEPMFIYGPEGETHELGVEALVENLYKVAAWHDTFKKAVLDPRGFDMRARQFGASQNEVVYDSDGAKITSFPVPHGLYGAVGYRLDWKGMSLVYSGDCEPNTFTVENSQDVDVLIHEIFNTPDTYVKYQGWTEQMAKIVSWTVHTAPEAAAEVFSRTNPRLAVGFHSMIVSGTPQPILDALRTRYDGPVLISQDFTVVNITPDQIVTRMVKSEPAPFLTPPDDAYVKSKGGSQSKTMHLLPDWLDESIIKLDFIEEFRRELKSKSIE
jgi:ribonuclease Z